MDTKDIRGNTATIELLDDIDRLHHNPAEGNGTAQDAADMRRMGKEQQLKVQ